MLLAVILNLPALTKVRVSESVTINKFKEHYDKMPGTGSTILET